jgi:hypothetical protein
MGEDGELRVFGETSKELLHFKARYYNLCP